MKKSWQNYKKIISKNGAQVILIQRPEIYTSHLACFFKGGPVFETRKISGSSHFVEHLLFRGNKKYKTSKKMDEEQERLGLSYGALTEYDYIKYFATFPPQELLKTLEFSLSLSFEGLLDEKEIEKERQIILEEEGLREDNLSIRAWDFCLKKRFKKKNHPLALPREGLPESIKKITARQLQDFYQNYFSPSNLMLALGSNLALEDQERILTKTLAKFRMGKKINYPEFGTEEFSNFLVEVEKKEAEKTYLYFTFPAFSLKSKTEERLGTYLWSRILRRIRLDKRLFQEKGLSYDWSASWFVPCPTIGFFWMYSSCHPKNLPEVMKIFFEELLKLYKKPVTENELEREKSYLNKITAMEFDNLQGAVDWFLHDFFYFGRFYSPEEIISIRQSITTDFIFGKIARKILDFDKLNITILGPTSKKEVLPIIRKHVAKI
jgi:predicted Zn-dependent peptidase